MSRNGGHASVVAFGRPPMSNHYTDQYTYRLPVVRELLGPALDGYVPQGPPGGGSTPGDPAEGGNVLAMLCDIRRALTLLPGEHRGEILLAHAGYVPNDTADHGLALEALVAALNGD